MGGVAAKSTLSRRREQGRARETKWRSLNRVGDMNRRSGRAHTPSCLNASVNGGTAAWETLWALCRHLPIPRLSVALRRSSPPARFCKLGLMFFVPKAWSSAVLPCPTWGSTYPKQRDRVESWSLLVTYGVSARACGAGPPRPQLVVVGVGRGRCRSQKG